MSHEISKNPIISPSIGEKISEHVSVLDINTGAGTVGQTKYIRQRLDGVLQELKAFEQCAGGRRSRERSLAVTKIQEGIMWLGMDLKAINEENPGAAENPYPHSYDPKSPIIDKTADGLKL